MRPPVHRRRERPARVAALAAATALLVVGCQRAMPLEPAAAPPAESDPGATTQPAPPHVTPAIRFALRNPGTLTVRIYDVQGSLVRTIRRDLWAGAGLIAWDGLTDSGIPVGSGMYTYRVDGPDGIRFDGRLIVVS